MALEQGVETGDEKVGGQQPICEQRMHTLSHLILKSSLYSRGIFVHKT